MRPVPPSLMEAAESWHAERPPRDPSSLGRRRSGCRGRRRSISTACLVSWRPRCDPERQEFSGAHGTASSPARPAWLPYEIVHTDYRLPQPLAAGVLPRSVVTASAPGNAELRPRATRYYELIERDALSLWQQRAALRRRTEESSSGERKKQTPVLAALVETPRGRRIAVALHGTSTE